MFWKKSTTFNLLIILLNKVPYTGISTLKYEPQLKMDHPQFRIYT
jgi:hypothetical protein